jgi:hypothetical protein
MTTERLTISFDPEKGKLRITDGGNTTMWAPVNQRRELVARFNKWREDFGRPALPDPDLPEKEPEIPYWSFNIDPLTGKPLSSIQRPKSPKRKPRKSPVTDKPSPTPRSGVSPANDTRSTKTTVVHVRKAKEHFHYIGRAFAEFGESVWHNPFKIELGCGRKCVLEKYEAYVRSRPDLMAQLHTLKGKALGCWCKDKHGRGKACHGDVLVKLIEETLVDE